MLLLSLLAILLVVASIVLVSRALALPRLKAAERVRGIEAYGFHATAVAPPPRPTFADLAGRIGQLAAARMKGVQPELLRRELIAAGFYRTSPQALLGYRVLGLVAMSLLAVLTIAPRGLALAVPAVAVFGALGYFGPLVVVRRRARMRIERIERDLPDVIDLLVVTIEAGAGLGASLQTAAARFEGPLADELRLTLQEQRMGRSMGESLDRMLQRADTPGMRSFVRSINQGETLGVSIGTIMRNLAGEMRKRRRASAEEQAQKAPVKMLFPLVFLILPALLVVIIGPALFNIGELLGG